MNFLKRKNRFFSLLVLFAFAIFFTACEKEELVKQEDQSSLVISTSGDASNLASLPVSQRKYG